MSDSTHVLVSAVDPGEPHPGIQVRVLWQGPDGAQAQVIDMAPGARFRKLQVRGGSEAIFVVSGVFNDGLCDYPAGSFVHYPPGSSQLPQSPQGCRLFVFLPEG
jgi:anti-sigma factor ChrR (cupin superfamily)